MIRRPPRSTQSRSSAASDVYKRQSYSCVRLRPSCGRDETRFLLAVPRPSHRRKASRLHVLVEEAHQIQGHLRAEDGVEGPVGLVSGTDEDSLGRQGVHVRCAVELRGYVGEEPAFGIVAVSYTHLRAHETDSY